MPDDVKVQKAPPGKKFCPSCKKAIAIFKPKCVCGYDFKANPKPVEPKVVKPKAAPKPPKPPKEKPKPPVIEFTDDDLPPLPTEVAVPVNKVCPGCSASCYHLAPFCPKCEWNFITNAPKPPPPAPKTETTEDRRRTEDHKKHQEWLKENAKYLREREIKWRCEDNAWKRKFFMETTIGQVVNCMELAKLPTCYEMYYPKIAEPEGDVVKIVCAAYDAWHYANLSCWEHKTRLENIENAKKATKDYNIPWDAALDAKLMEFGCWTSADIEGNVKASEAITRERCKFALALRKKSNAALKKATESQKNEIVELFTRHKQDSDYLKYTRGEEFLAGDDLFKPLKEFV